MAALAYTLGKREINYYFSVRSAKALALGAVLLLTACHAASRRYRGEGAAAGSGGHAGRGTGPDPERGSPGRPPRARRRLVQVLRVGHGTRGGNGVVLRNAGALPLCV